MHGNLLIPATVDADVTVLPATAGPLLEVAGLSVEFHGARGSVRAVDDIGFSVRSGERVCIIGESGSGKTAACLAIAGFITAGNADVTIDRLVFDGRPVDRTRRGRLPVTTPGVAMMFQDAMTSLDPVWTIGSQLVAVLRGALDLSRREAKDQAREWLVRVGLRDTERVMRSRPYELSGGMRQRAMLALAMCGRPRLLIADEPTSALDAGLARDAMELLLELTGDAGTALLIVSHDIRLSGEYSDRTIVMYGGRVVEQVDSRSLHERARHPYTTGLLASVPTLESAGLDRLPTIAVPSTGGQQDPDGGCSFRPRCAAATSECLTAPPVSSLGSGHEVRCWNAAPVPVAIEATS